MTFVVLERLYTLYRSGIDGEWLLKQCAIFLKAGRIDKAIEFCKSKARLF
jgi:hypothetical protein